MICKPGKPCQRVLCRFHSQWMQPWDCIKDLSESCGEYTSDPQHNRDQLELFRLDIPQPGGVLVRLQEQEFSQ